LNAIVSFMDGIPVCLGFLFPNVSQIMFKDAERKIDRHASDFYTTIDAGANMEMSHPSGAYIRIAESTGHEDLAGKDFDRIWNIKRNKGKGIHVHIQSSDADTFVSISPDGIVHVKSSDRVFVEATNEITLSAPLVTIDAAMTACTGSLSVSGNLTHGGPPCCCC